MISQGHCVTMARYNAVGSPDPVSDLVFMSGGQVGSLPSRACQQTVTGNGRGYLETEEIWACVFKTGS